MVKLITILLLFSFCSYGQGVSHHDTLDNNISWHAHKAAEIFLNPPVASNNKYVNPKCDSANLFSLILGSWWYHTGLGGGWVQISGGGGGGSYTAGSYLGLTIGNQFYLDTVKADLKYQHLISGSGIVKSSLGTLSYISGPPTSFIKADGSLDVNAYLTGNQTIILTGDMTGSGTTSISTTITANAVTYSKIQIESSSTILGNPTGSSRVPEEITLIANQLSFTGTTFGISVSYVGQGSITTVGTLSSGSYQATPILDAYIASAATWNSKQSALSGSGIVKSSSGAISYISGPPTSFIKADGSLDVNSYLSSGSSVGGDLAGTLPNPTFAVTSGAGLDAINTINAATSATINAARINILNQNTTGSSAKWTTARLLCGNSVDGSSNVQFSNNFIMGGVSDAGLSGGQFLGLLSTGLLKVTTATGVLSTAVAGTDYQAPISFGSGVLNWLITPTSTNLAIAVTDETGSGSLVFSNTPTLISPILGTPTSGTATNLTGLPLTTGVIGILSASNGGTGVSNNASSTWTILGNFGTSITVTASTSITLPTSGTVATLSNSETLTNKRMAPRIVTITASATPSVNTDNGDIFIISGLTTAITSMTTNLTGTPRDGEIIQFRITGTASRALSFGASFIGGTVPIPSSTVGTATLTISFQWFVTSSYGSNIWICTNNF